MIDGTPKRKHHIKVKYNGFYCHANHICTLRAGLIKRAGAAHWLQVPPQLCVGFSCYPHAVQISSFWHAVRLIAVHKHTWDQRPIFVASAMWDTLPSDPDQDLWLTQLCNNMFCNLKLDMQFVPFWTYCNTLCSFIMYLLFSAWFCKMENIADTAPLFKYTAWMTG